MARGTRSSRRGGPTKFQVAAWIVSALVAVSMVLSMLPIGQ